MPTDKPLISVYLDPGLHQKVLEYKQQQGIKSASAAIGEILEQFFAAGKDSGSDGRLAALESRVDELADQVDRLSQALENYQSSTLPTRSPPLDEPAQPIAPVADNEPPKRIRQRKSNGRWSEGHCPKCGSTNQPIIDGYRPNKAEATAVKLKCKVCGELTNQPIDSLGDVL